MTSLQLLPVKNRVYLLLLLCISLIEISVAGPPVMRRICKNGPDNILYFYPSTDTCTAFSKYYIWGKDGASNPYQLIDSVAGKSADQYTHTGANPAGNPKTWYYYIVYQDSCTPPLTQYSDTLVVDQSPPEPVFLDSVSVDPATQKVILGWASNKSSDFFRYLVFKDSAGNTVEFSPVPYRDTSITDPLTNPSLKPAKYDITATDSCGFTQVYGTNPHTTIHLQISQVDTCLNTAQISWTPYIGWPSIRSYHIIINRDGAGFVTLDSVDGSISTYLFNIQLGSSYVVFIRAFHGGKPGIASASNQSGFSTRFRTEPSGTYLANVTATDPDGTELTLTTLVPGNQEYLAIRPSVSPAVNYPTFTDLPIQNVPPSQITTKYTIGTTTEIYTFRVSGINLCGKSTDQSNTGTNLVLKTTGEGTFNSLQWNAYRFWDSGVEKYRIYRGTNVNTPTLFFEMLDSVPASDTQYTDQNPLQEVGNRGNCYFIEAIQNNGSPHLFKATSKSFASCIMGEFVVYVPNAFVPAGINRIFRPEGSYIDYDKSSMIIFDRWGGEVIRLEGISNGWDGKRQNGDICEQGVYFYQLNIVSSNGRQEIKKGTVTLLN